MRFADTPASACPFENFRVTPSDQCLHGCPAHFGVGVGYEGDQSAGGLSAFPAPAPNSAPASPRERVTIGAVADSRTRQLGERLPWRNRAPGEPLAGGAGTWLASRADKVSELRGA